MATYLAISPHHWGKGGSPEEAKAELKRQRGALGPQYLVLEMPPLSREHYVDQLGHIRWRWDEDADRSVEPVEVQRKGSRAYSA